MAAPTFHISRFDPKSIERRRKKGTRGGRERLRLGSVGATVSLPELTYPKPPHRQNHLKPSQPCDAGELDEIGNFCLNLT